MSKVEMMRGRSSAAKGQPSWIALGVVGLLPFVASCSGGADADESQPAVLESASPSSDDGTAGAADAASDDAEEPSDEGGAEEEEPEPVPASSEGPAENWPVPEIPDEIYEPTEEGAEALIQYWFDARHHARITGDLDVLENVSLEDCELCTAELQAISEVFPEGWFLDEQPDEVRDSYVRLEGDGIASGLFELRMYDFETFVDGVFYSETRGNPDVIFGLDFRYDDGKWRANDFNPLGEAESLEDAEL